LMPRSFGSRILLTICGALVLLLGTLAVMQIRWSMRVAAADAQREREHLDSAAALFATEFNNIVGSSVAFLQSDAYSALRSGQRLTAVPKIIDELYYLDISPQGVAKAQRLTVAGFFEPSPVPTWMPTPRCAPLAIEQPPALAAPIFEIRTVENHSMAGMRALRILTARSQRCFVARINESYLRSTLFPQLIRQCFGETTMARYDFSVVRRTRPQDALYGSPLRADVDKPFFSSEVVFTRPPATTMPAPGQSAMYFQHVESKIVERGQAELADLMHSGIWELEIAHKGVPLAVAFEQTRRRDLLRSLGVVILLIAVIVFLVVAAGRMQRLANQKLQFVAGVSHELRTPVSAIAMLSRNQADGLVTGAERVRQYGELIHQQSRRLNEMVEQTLQYAGIHSGLRQPTKSEIDLRGLIQEAVDAQREDLARRGFEIEIALSPDLPTVVIGDAKLLRTAVDNLLSNVQKHAGTGRWIRVGASYSVNERQVCISVEDRGPGISPVDQETIFEPFSRGQAAIDAQTPGSGLGLSLVRSVAEAHNGTVTLVSEPGRGSTFTLHLPV
jgi:two-component system sensor histidine kinase SenX3